jgi:WhiB family redox-sensing transcriptional regulator
MNWRLLAACRGVDPAVFFPVRGDSFTRREAQRLCSTCPVRKKCLSEHLDELEGFWGGTSPNERRRLRKEQNVAARAPHEEPTFAWDLWGSRSEAS